MNFGQPPKKRVAPVNKVLPKTTLPKTNPLDDMVKKGEMSKDIEVSDKQETGTVMNLLKNVGLEADRVMGKDYYLVLVFPDYAAREAAIEKMDWDQFSEDNVFFDGLAILKKLGIELKVAPIRFKSRRSDARLVNEVGIYEPAKKPTKGKAKG